MTKKLTLIAVAAGLLATATFLPALFTPAKSADTNSMDKAAIEKIVHDYIMNNPDVILTSVDQYQQKTMAEQQRKSLEQNAGLLFNNDKSPSVGNPEGDVTIVEFFDYNCGYCKSVFSTVEQLLEEDKNVKIIFKEFPILSPSSELAAKWALAADNQGKYFEFHKALMEHRGKIDDAVLEGIAEKLELDIAQMKEDIAGTDIILNIERNRSLANTLAISGTPAFIVGDEIVPGAVSASRLKDIIAEKRAAAKDGDTEKAE